MTQPTAPQILPMPDVIWTGFTAWTAHLHDAEPVNFGHTAADAEYLPPSPVADRMRAAVNAELDLRQVTA
jgi:hypothetical protein